MEYERKTMVRGLSDAGSAIAAKWPLPSGNANTYLGSSSDKSRDCSRGTGTNSMSAKNLTVAGCDATALRFSATLAHPVRSRIRSATTAVNL
jgi:hypothetical protein